MCEILHRIKEIAERENVTIGAIERMIGASKGVLSRAINNGTDIQSKWLVAIVENYPQYSTRWLLTGEGDMMHTTTKASTSQTIEAPNYLLDMIKEKDTIIREQAEELGELRLRLKLSEAGKNEAVRHLVPQTSETAP